MDPVGATDTFMKDETTVLFDAAAVARRKRMEIRRFKQMSGSCRSAHSHGVHKRSRPLSAGICELCDVEQNIYPLSDDETESDASQFLAEREAKEVFGQATMTSGNSLFRGGGLVRSKSFPPEGWHRSSNFQCVFKLSKTSRACTATGVEGRVVTVVSDESYSTMVDIQPGFCANRTAEVSSSPTPCVLKANAEEGDVSRQQRAEESMVTQHVVESSSSTPRFVAEARPEESSTGNAVCDLALPEGFVESSPSDANSGSMDIAMEAASTNLMLETASESIASKSHCFSDGKCPPSGKLLVCGRRREMEDTVAIVPSFASLPCDTMGGCLCGSERDKKLCSDLHFFAVYDGHGGSQASKFCMERLHVLLGEELSSASSLCDLAEGHCDLTDGWGSKWKNVLTSCFMKIDKEVGGVCPTGECDDADGTSTCCADAIAPENVGTTAVVAVVGSCQIIVGNCGDSRAVLSRGGKAIPLSQDHKPERDDETSRIEAAGGRVIYWDGYRVGGLLALSRALGDRYLKRYVIAEPEVICLQRTEEDECLILASDGLWDVISSEFACEVARKCLATARRKCESGISSPGEDSAAAQVASLLVKLAYGRGSKDNISVVVADLRWRGR